MESFFLLIAYKNTYFLAKTYILSRIIYLVFDVKFVQRADRSNFKQYAYQLKMPYLRLCPGEFDSFKHESPKRLLNCLLKGLMPSVFSAHPGILY